MDFLKKGEGVRIFLSFVFLCFFIAPVLIAEEQPSGEGDHINIYYFRGNFRCSNCYKIEEYTKEAVEKYFKDKIDSGEIVYRAINIDEKENNHFVYDYQLYTKSVVLSRIADGKEAEYKNLEKIWEYLDDKAKFCSYIEGEIRGFLDKSEGAAE